jgi:cysteine desulfurase
MKKVVYLDNAATTPVRREVILAMKPFWNESFGNPGSITKTGVKAQQAVEKARKTIAESLIARPQEIIFTSGGTESNNLAIFGLVNNLEKKGIKISDMHFITTNIEHSSVSECFKELERRGAKVDYFIVNENGLVNPRDLRKLIKPNTILVSVGYTNNEIGVVQPIREIMKEVRYMRKINGNIPFFHTDASQAGLYCNLNINELGVDLMSLGGQKVHGPKGVGILFKKSTVNIFPIIFGGGQERGLRSGTENVPLIIGQAKALEIARKNYLEKGRKIKILRNYFWQKIQKEIPIAILNGDLENRLPNNLNISIPGINSEFTVLCLDEVGIVCSTKSACQQDSDGSFVIRTLYQNSDFKFRETLAKSSLRFSLGEEITKKDLNFVVKNLKTIIDKQLNNKII